MKITEGERERDLGVYSPYSGEKLVRKPFFEEIRLFGDLPDCISLPFYSEWKVAPPSLVSFFFLTSFRPLGCVLVKHTHPLLIFCVGGGKHWCFMSDIRFDDTAERRCSHIDVECNAPMHNAPCMPSLESSITFHSFLEDDSHLSQPLSSRIRQALVAGLGSLRALDSDHSVCLFFSSPRRDSVLLCLFISSWVLGKGSIFRYQSSQTPEVQILIFLLSSLRNLLYRSCLVCLVSVVERTVQQNRKKCGCGKYSSFSHWSGIFGSCRRVFSGDISLSLDHIPCRLLPSCCWYRPMWL